MALFNLARMTVSSSGTGIITLNAAVTGFLTFDLSGCSTAAAGSAVTYAINDTTQSEIASGTYISSALSLSRGSSTAGMKSTNGNSPINMSNTAQVFITPQAIGVVGKMNIRPFTTAGSTTYFPTIGTNFVAVECIGGGGGGGGAISSLSSQVSAGGGGSGGYSKTYVSIITIGTSQAVIVGAAGTAGSSTGGGTGGAGGDSSFGTGLCIGKGGSGGTGTTGSNALGGAGGVVGTGDFTSAGTYGGTGTAAADVVYSLVSGDGAPSVYGGGVRGVVFANGVTASSNGGGGSGSQVLNGSAGTGGAGGAGLVIVTEYLSL